MIETCMHIKAAPNSRQWKRERERERERESVCERERERERGGEG